MRLEKTPSRRLGLPLRRLGLIVIVTVLGLALPALAAGKKYPWAKPPGPIAGKWKACSEFGQTVIEFTVEGKKASGKIITPHEWAKKRGYKAGEEIFQLTVDDYGAWVGTLVWRSVAGAQRQDPIRMVAKAQTMSATMTTDKCYKAMTRQ